MMNKKCIGSIVGMAIIWIGSVNTPSGAGTVSGTFQGTADMSVQPEVLNQLGNTTFYTDVPSTLDVTVSWDDPNHPSVQFSLENSVFSLSLVPISPVTSIDGSVTADSIHIDTDTLIYHLYTLGTTIGLSDPSGQFLTGNTDMSNVQAFVAYTDWVSNYQATGERVTASFTSNSDPLAAVPEPSSIMMAASGALMALTVALVRARRARHP